MAATTDTPGSDVNELKTLFKAAQSKPVNAAFGLGPDGHVVVKLDKMQRPQALMKLLLAAKVKPVYCGTVSIDSSEPAMANFAMEKAVSGIENKLIVALKGSGVSKVNITVAGDAAPGAPGAGDDAGADDSDAPQAAAQPDAADQPAAGAAPAAGPDMGALTAELTAAVKQMMTVMASNPGAKATLVPLATAAQAALKGGDAQQAATALTSLQQAIAQAGSAAPAGGAAGPGAPPAANGAADPAQAQKLQKSQQIWTATRAKINAELQKLTKAVLAAAEGDDMAEGLEQQFTSAVEPVLQNLDDSLSDTLSKAAAATDPGERQQLMQQAQALLAGYQQFVTSNQIIAHLDNNPFVPLAIGKTLTATITALSSSVH